MNALIDLYKVRKMQAKILFPVTAKPKKKRKLISR